MVKGVALQVVNPPLKFAVVYTGSEIVQSGGVLISAAGPTALKSLAA